METLYRTNIRGEPITINDRFLRAKQAAEKCGINRATVYRLMDNYEFPPSHQITKGRVAWLEADVEEFMKLGAEGFNKLYGELLKAKDHVETHF